jgi:acyl-CoA thioesterase
MGDFEQDTAVRAVAEGSLSCDIRPDWWVVNGPNGGYVAAILVRAMSANSAADERPLRSLTVHFQRPPEAGPAEIEVTVERQGRSVSFMRAALSQGGRVCAGAVAVFARDRTGLELDHARAPVVPGPEETDQLPDRPEAPPFGREFDFRPAIGKTGFGEADEALTGGWLRFRDERPLDAPALVALCDSWFPAVFAVSDGPLAVPTLELTVHVRAPLPLAHDWVLGRYATRLARDGFLEEDAELFSRDGRLLAQSRQLALAG